MSLKLNMQSVILNYKENIWRDLSQIEVWAVWDAQFAQNERVHTCVCVCVYMNFILHLLYQMCGVQVSCQSQKPALSWLSDPLQRMCAHPATRRIILGRKPHPSGARADLNKPREALCKQSLSQVWRWSPDDAPSADRHDKQFLSETIWFMLREKSLSEPNNKKYLQ